MLYRLQTAGYAAYLVGGGIRDLLTGCHPKDFDVVTDARPEQIKRLFHRCFLIGKRFRLAHVYFGSGKVEVATFRAGGHPSLFNKKHYLKSKVGMVMRDNVYGSLEEDVWRRDFTVNAIYYNIADFSLVDYCGGLEDMNNKSIRVIGNPLERYHEDPVRLLRAVRFAAKLDFNIESETEAPLFELGELLQHVSPSRLGDEVQKLFLSGFAEKSFLLLRRYQLFKWLFAQTDFCLTEKSEFMANGIVNLALKDMDVRFNEGRGVSAAFLFSIMLWPAMQHLYYQYLSENMSEPEAYEKASVKVLAQQNRQFIVVRRTALMVHEIWRMQRQLLRRGVHAAHLLKHHYFHFALDFLKFRIMSGEDQSMLLDWWRDFHTASTEEQQTMLEVLPAIPRGHHSKRRRGRRRRYR